MDKSLPVVEFDTSNDLTNAFIEGKVKANVIYHIKSNGIRWKLDITKRGFVEVHEQAEG